MRKTVNGTKTLYVHDGEHIVQELDASEALQATFRYGTGLDQPLTMERGGQTYWYQADSLGSIIGLADAAGDLVESYRYDAFGETVILDGTGSPLTVSAFDNPWMYTGRQLDPETGLYHYRARAYSPANGRFLQRDPLNQYPDTNVYRYAANQPLDLIDPFGLTSEKCSGSQTPGRRSWLRFAIDLAGLIPGIGTPFKLIDAALCFSERDVVGGLLSLNAAVPFTGWPAAVMKVLRTVDNATNVTNAARTGRGGAEGRGTIFVDPAGNAIPTPRGGKIEGSPDGRFIQVKDAAGTPTGVRKRWATLSSETLRSACPRSPCPRSRSDECRRHSVASSEAVTTSMNTPSFTYGDPVRVKPGAPANFRPGDEGDVVAITRVDSEALAMHYDVPIGSTMYQVEFGDGSDVEISAIWLEAVQR